MKRLIIALLLLIILLVIIWYLPKNNETKSSITINGKTFVVDVAKTNKQKEKGLAIYDTLPLDKGMVFIFKYPDYYAFWMKDMKFPIDIIYIKQNKITDIYKNVPTPTGKGEKLPIIRPKEKSDTVLEINANLSDKYNFKIGDLVRTNY